MQTGSTYPRFEERAAEQVRRAKHRLEAWGLAGRTGLALGLLGAMAVDLTLLEVPEGHTLITGAQSLLLLAALASVLRKDPREHLLPGPRRSRARIAWQAASFVVGSAALSQKWWIAMLETDTRAAYSGSYRVMGVTATLAALALTFGHSRRLVRFFAAFAEQPARQTAVSFAGLAILGALLLTLPVCVRDPRHVSFMDALFMATSAVCVTGLAVHAVAAEYTLWGQAVLLLLVQVGGIGIMVLSASLVVLTGRKLKARSSAALAEVLDADSIHSLRGNILRIVGYTLTIEAFGAVALYVLFTSHPGVAHDVRSAHPMAGAGSWWWAAVFHAVSAFCNAGFSLARTNMEPFVSSYGVCCVLMLLIVLGGLGFPVMSELTRWLGQRARRRRGPRVSLHTRVVLIVSGTLTLAIAALLALVEWNGALARLAWHDRLFAALFQSVTLRTAGFNTIDFGSLADATLMICMLFMFVGASPGGTGGGVKVTTFAVLYSTLRAELRNEAEPHLLDRRVPPATVRRAISVAFVAVVVVTFSVLGLLLSQRGDAMRLAFEAVSAFGTVGLSTGVTPLLTKLGKSIIIVTMLIGRVGPLTVALATAERSRRAHHLHPQERVLIG